MSKYGARQIKWTRLEFKYLQKFFALLKISVT